MKNSDKILTNQFSVKDKVIALIGSVGILGREYVDLFSSHGAKVVIGDIDYAECVRLKEEMENLYQSDCLAIEVDNSDEESIKNFFLKITSHYGKLDVLINNAQGKPEGFYAPFEKYSKETLMKVIDINLVGIVIACQQASNIFLKSTSGGVIINVASTYGVVGADQRIYDGVKNIYFPEEKFSSPVSYAITKSAVLNLTRYLASYFREKNIRVNTLTPGGVFDDHDDAFLKSYSAKTILGRMANKQEYNGAILFLASDASSYMTGGNLIVDGGWTAI